MLSCVSETANPRVHSLSTTTPPCALPKRGTNITSLSSLSLSFSIFHIILSVTSFQNFYHQFVMTFYMVTILHIQLLAGGMVPFRKEVPISHH